MEHHANMPRSRKSLRTNDHRALDLVRIADLQNTNGFIGVPMVDIPSTPLLAAWNSKVISRTGEEFINALIRDPGGSHSVFKSLLFLRINDNVDVLPIKYTNLKL